jgi:dihydropyrimidinase
VVVFDPAARKTVTADGLESAAGYSLYEDETLTGWPAQVFVRGNIVLDGGKIVDAKPAGRHVPAS